MLLLKAWAWKSWRAKALSKRHTLFTILPFEKNWFKRGVSQVKSVPHPLYHHFKNKLGKHSLGLAGKLKGRKRQKKSFFSQEVEILKLRIYCLNL